MQKLSRSIVGAASLLIAAHSWSATATSANVMAPLDIKDWGAFERNLSTAKSYGVTGVSVDVWWGRAEAAGDQQFDWSYYDAVFQRILNAGLNIVPIMSFHQCGGNVGDDCDIPIPAWIWDHYASSGVSAEEMKYISEFGNPSIETVSLWRDQYVLEEYQEFMEAFEAQYSGIADRIDELNVSMGPAGELRYPSYNSHDGELTDYPTRGGFQSYSEPAKDDFRNWALERYGSVSGVSNAWGITLTSLSDINPPADGGSFIYNGDQYDTAYGRDFVRWYHDALINHGYRMLDTALQGFDGAFANIELGYKIPGIHWKMSATDRSVRSAEMAAGLIPSDVDLNSDATGHGYSDIIGIAAAYANESRGITLHFTALEMNDNPSSGESLAKSLVFWVANEAEAQGVTIKGENALQGGVYSSEGWDNINNAFAYASYSGMTVLRVDQVTDGGIGQKRYTDFIRDRYQPKPKPGDWQRTVIFIYGTTVSGQDMFVRGGIDHDYANTQLGRNCQTTNFECAIPIMHNNLRNVTTAGWKAGDQYLDWYGLEAQQGLGAEGTALDWTTNQWPDSWGEKRTVAIDGYGEEVLNEYGQHYWMLDVQMDCSATVQGWFELKSYISNGPAWEDNVAQAGTPYQSGNHFAQCGKVNVFERNSGSAIIGDL